MNSISIKLLEKKKMKYRKNKSETSEFGCLQEVGGKSMKERENGNAEEGMSGEWHFTEYVCSHGNFSYIIKMLTCIYLT